jgi:hypothetical protein
MTSAAPLAAWLAVLCLSALLAPSHASEALTTLARPIGGVLLAWTAYQVTPSRSSWRLLCTSLALGGLAVGLVGLADMAGLPAIRASLQRLHDTLVPI